MLNVKALTWALALTAALMFCIFVVGILIVPADYQPGSVWGTWLPIFHGITPLGFLFGLIGAAGLGAVAGLLIGGLNNVFHHQGQGWIPLWVGSGRHGKA